MQRNTVLISSILFTVAYCILGLCLGKIVWHPNAYGMTMGGDGLKIYFDSLWHARWGNGFFFTGMNFPHQELINLSGGQAFVNVVLAFLQSLGIRVSNYAVGITNWLNQILVPIGVVIAYRLCLRLGLNNFFAIIGAFVLIFCSPLIDRMGGHFNLAYPFFIPLVLLWMLNIIEAKRIQAYSLLLFVLLLIMGFNNAYFLLLGAAFVLGVGILYFFINARKGLIIALIGLLPIVINFILIHYLDKTTGRVAVPYGFMDNTNSLQGLFAQNFGEVSIWWQKIFGLHKLQNGEGVNYLGILAIPTILAWVYLSYSKKEIQVFKKPFLLIIFLVSFALLILAFGVIITDKPAYWETKLPFLMQFRAIGRAAIPFFYVFTIVSLICWQSLLCNSSKPMWRKVIYGFILICFGLDFFSKLDNSLLQSKKWQGENVFLQSTLNNLPALDRNKYAAIAMFPPVQLWTDKIIQLGDYNTILYGMQYALKSGIPLSNAMLSRMSYWETLDALQLSSSPYIKRKLLGLLPENKSLLILANQSAALSEGEKWHLQNATKLFDVDSNTAMYSFNPRLHRDTAGASNIAKAVLSGTSKQEAYIFKDFAKSNRAVGLGGKYKTAFQYTAGKPEVLFEADLDYFTNKSNLVCSFWTKSSVAKYGNATVLVEIIDRYGKMRIHDMVGVRESKEIYNGWIRAYLPIWYNADFKTLRLSAVQEDATFDSFFLQEMDKNIGMQLPNGALMFNNIPIDAK